MHLSGDRIVVLICCGPCCVHRQFHHPRSIFVLSADGDGKSFTTRNVPVILLPDFH